MTRQPLSAVFIGDGTLLAQCAEHFLQTGHDVRGVITSEPLITRWASSHGVPHHKPDADLLAFLTDSSFDYLFSIANLTVLSEDVLKLPRRGAINFHDSLLPKYAGLYATSWAILGGENVHGITWHEMVDRVDAGRIVHQRVFPVSENETAFSLNTKCYEAGIESFAELVNGLASETLAPVDQELAARTYFPRDARPPAACVIRWETPAAAIAALARALHLGPYSNPLGLPKLAVGDQAIVVASAAVGESDSKSLPGTITRIGPDVVQVATVHQDVLLREFRTSEGKPLAVPDLVTRFGLRVGLRFPSLGQEEIAQLTRVNRALCGHESFWIRRLACLEPVALPYANRSASLSEAMEYATTPFLVPSDARRLVEGLGDTRFPGDPLIVAFVAYLARLVDSEQLVVSYSDPALRREIAGLEGFFATHVPLRLECPSARPVDVLLRSGLEELEAVRDHLTFARDAIARYPELAGLIPRGNGGRSNVVVELVDDVNRETPPVGSDLALFISFDGMTARWFYDPRVLATEDIATMDRHFAAFLGQLIADRARPLGELSLLVDDERRLVLDTWNDTGHGYSDRELVHDLVEAQVERTPDAVALIFQDQQLTYRELDARANQLAWHLQRQNVGTDTRVGICVDRGLDLVIALLGVLKAGGAYVPLDPTFPRERLAFMVADAGLTALVTQTHLTERLPKQPTRLVCLDRDWDVIAREGTEHPPRAGTPGDLAYVIYTSGSTGRPKGVMVEHRNVVSFFVGMDDRINHEPPGVWLAVTSVSFDISVLELLWTLARGFTVVLHGELDHVSLAGSTSPRRTEKGIEFSLFYFASDEQHVGPEKYRLLLEGAKFADQRGFAAVWTPERHFHAFGGLYPNPAVTGAAIAAITERIHIRAGSCVLPLHNPIRVAEEWALVDNLSNGRVGVSFASGWQPDDFVLAPPNFAERRRIMREGIATVRRLWRGETVALPGPTGQSVRVATLPRPIQLELPIWITAAGSPETFQLAGDEGAGLLTHLLGQSVEDVAQKIALYRQAWRGKGHGPGNGHVTLMLHTFIGDDVELVRSIVRQPLKDYLRSSVDLIRQAAWTFPTFQSQSEKTGKTPGELFDGGGLSDDEMDALLDHAFERYFTTSGLFGTPATCLATIEKLKAMGVDEVACLIDFGVETELVLEHLAHLDQLKNLSARPEASSRENYTIDTQIRRHGVTHIQCTPATARMLVADDRTRDALRGLKQLLVGGETFPVDLARDLTTLVPGGVVNLYGPTETTIWSSTYRLDDVAGTVSIGRPIANTELYILDSQRQPVPIGVPGELFIGGAGVARGYLGRPELTDERFIGQPFREDRTARLYRTGDVARYRPDGNVDLLGRLDYQVKVRGYRVELGEIEAVLREHPAVGEAAVVAREDQPGDRRLVAYVVPRVPQPATSEELRGYLASRLPDYMLPGRIVSMSALPLTPNGKLDRQALPEPERVDAADAATYVAPRNALEATMTQLWQEVLGVGRVGVHDDFFALGGHSLSAAQLAARLRRALAVELPLRSFFGNPTVAQLALEIERLRAGDPARAAPAIARLSRDSHQSRLSTLRRPPGSAPE